MLTRSSKLIHARHIALLLVTLGALLLPVHLPVFAVANLTITPITWNVVGLDSNNVNVGPNVFPVGARVCNTGDTAAANVVSTFVWDSANAFIDLRPGSLNTYSIPSLAAGSCTDFYYEVQITRNAAAYTATRRYHLTVTADTLPVISTPTPREIYVERLVSQNRNTVSDVRLNGVSVAAGGTMTLLVGNTYSIQLVGSTATNGYEQVESYINFPNTIFQVNSVTTTFSANAGTDPLATTKVYADGCVWINDPASPNYRACTGTGKYGGNITVTYNVTIIGGGGTNQTLNTLIYDFSGSSYHYNSDFGAGARIASIVDPATSVTIAKAFSPSSTVAGGTSTLTFTITNPTSVTITGVNFTDNLPASPGVMTVASTPNAATSGCGTPTFAPAGGATSLSFSNGTLAPNSTCTISVSVSVPASPTSGTYANTSNNLFINALDTGRSASANLTLTTASAGTNFCGLTLAAWVFPTASSATAPAPSTANVTASASPGTGITPIISTQDNTASPTGTGSWGSNGAIASGVLNTANNDYFEFAIDTTGYASVFLRFDARRTNNGPQNLHVYYGTSATPPGTAAYNLPNALTAASTWFSFGSSDSLSFTSGLNPAGTTYFRIYAANANNSVPGSDIYLDNVLFTGCGIAQHPTLTKTFLTNPIAVNATATLRFTLTNPNTTALTGVRFTDALPAGLEVAAVPGASTTCGGTPTWAPAAGATTLTFGTPTGATIPAGSTCTVSVSIRATTSGPHTNVSGFISSTESGTNSGSSGSATATLTALQPPAITKVFNPNPILVNGTSILTFLVTNPNPNDSLSSVAFSDTFPTSPAAMTVAAAPNASTSGCGSPTFAPTAGAASISFSNGTIAAGGTCTVAVAVTAPASGSYLNTTGAVSTVIAGVTSTGNTDSDTLVVNTPNPAISLLKQIATSPAGPWSSFISVTPGTNIYYQFTIENTGDVPLSPVSVTDPTVSTAGCSWPAVLPVASPIQDPTATCVVGPLVAAAGSNPNTATAHGTYSATTYDSPPSSADYLGAAPGFSLLKQVSTSASGPWSSALSGVSPGSNLFYRFTVNNTGGISLTSVSVGDPDISGEESCAFTNPLPPGSATICVVGPITAALVDGTYPNTATAAATNTAETPQSSAVYTVSASPADLIVTKTNDAGGTVTLPATFTWTLTISNQGAGGAAFADGQVIVSDPLPAGPAYGAPSVGGAPVNVTNPANISCAIAAGTLSCAAAGAPVTIGAAGNFTVSFSVTPAGAGSLVNIATVDPRGTVVEVDEGNNTGSDTVSVLVSGPEMTITKVADVTSVDSAGDIVNYTITVDNTGNVPLTGVTVDDGLAGCTLSGPAGDTNTNSQLDITETWTYTCAYVVTQADIDTDGGGDGLIDNTATADTDQTSPETAGETVTIVQAPAVSLTKTADVASVSTAGDLITYTVLVENTGNLTLTGVSVSDPLLANLDCDGVAGAPLTTTGLTVNVGAALTCTGTYTLTQADIDGSGGGDGDIDNTVTADTDQTGPQTADESVTILVSADFVITKSGVLDMAVVAPAGRADAGDQIDYTVTVENTGNVTLTGISVSDPLVTLTYASGDTDLDTQLDVDETWTYTGTYTLTQADIDGNGGGDGDIDNTATADTGETGPEDGTAAVGFVQQPTLDLDKDITAGDPYDSVGDVISYSYLVTNTGNVSLTGPVTMTDDRASVTCPDVTTVGDLDGELDPGEALTCTATYTITLADLNAGSVTNTATASADGTDSNQDSATATATNTPALTLTKSITGGSPYDSVGDTIDYAYEVENTGNVSLTGPVTVTDDRASVTCPDVTTVGNLDGELDPGESVICTATYTVTLADLNAGSVTNTATASADGTDSNQDSATATATNTPALILTKSITGGDPYDSVGDTIAYQYVVENTGNVSLTGPVTVTDDRASVTCPDVTTVGNLDGELDPGETLTCTATYTVTLADLNAGSVTNTATASADGTDSNQASATATASQTPQLSLSKTITAGDPYTLVGDVISYSYLVTNTGNVSLTGPVTVVDDRTTVSCPAVTTVGNLDGELDPGEALTCTATYTVVLADITAGSVTNTATATADGTDSNQASATATALIVNPALSLTKVADVTSVDSAGDIINYTLTVDNTGDVVLTGVTVDDGLAGCTLSGPAGDTNSDNQLDIAETWTYTCAYTVTQADIDTNGGGDGTIDNTATADTDQTGPETATESVSLTLNTGFTVVKSADVTNAALGDLITYTITVTNTGSTTLTGVSVSDPLLADLDCDGVAGAPLTTTGLTVNVGAALTCTGTYTVAPADVTGNGGGDGDIDNTVTVDTNETAAQTADESVTVDQADLTVTKTVNDPSPSIGDAVVFTVTATNQSLTTAATNVVVTDLLPAGLAFNFSTQTVGTTYSNVTGAWTIPTLAAAASATLQINATVTQVGVIVNTAQVTAVDQHDPDSTPNNNNPAEDDQASSTLGSLFDPPSGRKTFSESGLPQLEFRMVWINSGNATAINVQITDTIPSGTTFVGGSLTCEPRGTSTNAAAATAPLNTTVAGSFCAFDSSGNQVQWQGAIGPDPGAADEAAAANEVVITFRVTVDGSTNQVFNQGVSRTDTDGDSSFADETTQVSMTNSNQVVWNRSATATPAPTATAAASVIDPNITKSVSPAQASVGQTVTYTMVVTNAGNTAATNVVVTDTVSSFLDIVTVTTTRGSASSSGQTATFNIGTVNPGDTITLTIETRVNSTSTTTQDISNVATLTHTSGGVTASENSGTVNVRLQGAATLPNAGEDPSAARIQALLLAVVWLSNLAAVLVGLILCGLGFYRRRYSRPAPGGAPADRPLPLRHESASIAAGILLLVASTGCSFTTLGLWGAVPFESAAEPAAIHPPSQPDSAPLDAPAAPPAQVVILGATPEPEATLPAYPLPAPPAGSEDFVLALPAAADTTPPALPTEAGPDTTPITRIAIPSHNVEAEVVFIPFDGLTWSLTGLRQQVAWMGNTSWPGLGGNTALTGHVTLRGGQLGPFYELGKMMPGDVILVYTERNVYTYAMREKRVVEPTDMYVLDPTDSPQLTLITCTAWDASARTYTRRQVVFADLVDVTPADPGPAP